MIRAFRRWWARITHRHEYEVIWRGRTNNAWDRQGVVYKTAKYDLILERCTCGHERAREWANHRWSSVDMDWLNDQFARQGIEISARHPE